MTWREQEQIRHHPPQVFTCLPAEFSVCVCVCVCRISRGAHSSPSSTCQSLPPVCSPLSSLQFSEVSLCMCVREYVCVRACMCMCVRVCVCACRFVFKSSDYIV